MRQNHPARPNALPRYLAFLVLQVLIFGAASTHAQELRLYYKADGAETCSGDDLIDSAQGCRTAGAFVGSPFNKVVQADASSHNGAGRPGGCFWDQNGYSYFNKNLSSSATWAGTGGLCQRVYQEDRVRLAGTYELQGSNGSLILSFVDGAVQATVKDLTVDSSNNMKIVSMKLNGWISLQLRQSEDFFLFNLHGEGRVSDGRGQSFPATFALTGFRSISGNAALTTHWSAAYEFPGNAEGSNGDLAVWRRKP